MGAGAGGAIRTALHIAYESKWTYFLLALVPSLCDCAGAALVYTTARRGRVGEHMALVLAAFTAFNPLLLFDTGVWKQIDGAFALPLLLCFCCWNSAAACPPPSGSAWRWLSSRRRCCSGRCWRPATWQLSRWKKISPAPLAADSAVRRWHCCPAGGGAAVFGIAQLLPKLVEKYTGTMSGYPYATINAFNWMAALGGNWKGLAETVLLGITWQQLGGSNILLVTAGLAYFAVRSARGGSFSPLLLAAYYGIGVFTLAHCMHERYMVPGVLLTLLAAAHWNDIRLYAAGVGLSLTGFINLATVYSLTGSGDEWLTSATSSTVAILTGLVETVCFVLLLFAMWDITRHTLPCRSVNPSNPAAACRTAEMDPPRGGRTAGIDGGHGGAELCLPGQPHRAAEPAGLHRYRTDRDGDATGRRGLAVGVPGHFLRRQYDRDRRCGQYGL